VTNHPNFEKGNTIALKHGATSERQIRPRTRNHRRRILRQLRLSPKDLDPLARGYLDSYVRLVAKIELIDAYVAEHGLLKSDGEPQPSLRLYVALQNSARLALIRLESHLHARDVSPTAALEGEGRRLRLEAEQRLRAVK
jgi:hypothetical protein